MFVVFAVEVLQASILAGETTFRGNVHDQQHLATVFAQTDKAVVDVIHVKLIDILIEWSFRSIVRQSDAGSSLSSWQFYGALGSFTVLLASLILAVLRSFTALGKFNSGSCHCPVVDGAGGIAARISLRLAGGTRSVVMVLVPHGCQATGKRSSAKPAKATKTSVSAAAARC